MTPLPALHALMDLLEARYALRVLWALRDGHRQTFRLLQDSVGGATPGTLNARLKQLRAAGLLDHGAGGYGLTAPGLDLARRLHGLPAFAGKWTARPVGHSPDTDPAVDRDIARLEK